MTTGNLPIKRTIISLLAGLSMASHAAPPAKLPLQEWQEAADYHLLMCKIEAKTSYYQVRLGMRGSYLSKISKCQKDAKSEIAPLYNKARAHVRTGTGAGLIKAHDAAWMSAIDGITPVAGETDVDYEQRQENLQKKYDQTREAVAEKAGMDN